MIVFLLQFTLTYDPCRKIASKNEACPIRFCRWRINLNFLQIKYRPIRYVIVWRTDTLFLFSYKYYYYMEERITTGVLQCMGTIFEKSKNNKLTEDFYKVAAPQLETIASYFRVTREQALLIAVLFSLNFTEENVTLLI